MRDKVGGMKTLEIVGAGEGKFGEMGALFWGRGVCIYILRIYPNPPPPSDPDSFCSYFLGFWISASTPRARRMGQNSYSVETIHCLGADVKVMERKLG